MFITEWQHLFFITKLVIDKRISVISTVLTYLHLIEDINKKEYNHYVMPGLLEIPKYVYEH